MLVNVHRHAARLHVHVLFGKAFHDVAILVVVRRPRKGVHALPRFAAVTGLDCAGVVDVPVAWFAPVTDRLVKGVHNAVYFHRALTNFGAFVVFLVVRLVMHDESQRVAVVVGHKSAVHDAAREVEIVRFADYRAAPVYV